ncbi:solute carrier family 22 member 18 isoform X3 [Heptranchias perlo]|uniref:solute carrier family 22 member 18 isoform X3 n=1 Tax=Heptranchias perlo TaxID=212740 RepID=UPI003559A650
MESMPTPEKGTGVRFVILVTHFNMALYSTCFWIQTGVMPYLSKRLGMDTVMFGYLQTTFAILQFLGGPLFGRESFAAYVAAAGSVLNTIVVLKYIPARTKPVALTKENKSETASSWNIFSMKEIFRLLSIPGAAGILTIKTIAGLPMGVFQSMFSVVAMDHFKLEAKYNGYLMAYIGVLQMVMQGLVVGWLTLQIAERTLFLWSILVICLVGLATALMTNVIHFCLICIPMSLGISVFYLTTNSILTKIVPPADTGAILGLNTCVHSLIRSVAPTIGGFLYELYGFSSFGYLQFVVNLLVCIYIFVNNGN